MSEESSLYTSDYWYELPADRIALFPVSPRDESQLLVYHQGKIEHRRFRQLSESVPEGALLIINDTRVIPARLLFKSTSGATIEVFLLEPVSPSDEPAIVLAGNSPCRWRCAIGNLKRWKSGVSLEHKVAAGSLRASLVDMTEAIVEFSWGPAKISFSEIIQEAGATPLPPYIKREAEPGDKESYQTIYSENEGAVAAPTAGLHFTDRVLKSLAVNKIQIERVTLHVGAGTFRPIKTERIDEHAMHGERIVVSLETVKRLSNWKKPVIPVGTTAVRTLESLYWFGVSLANENRGGFFVGQEDPYREWARLPDRNSSLQHVLEFMHRRQIHQLQGSTSLYIRPGYRFRFCDALITNFHQPGSTLLVLISALIGPEWRHVYEAALANNYRFLSYGDSSLLFQASSALPAAASRAGQL